MTDERWEAWLYLRKSKGRMGIARQRAIATAYVESHGGRIGRVYTDTDSTAYALPGQPPAPRKNFARLLTELPSHPGVRLAAWHADRILRNPEETEVLIRACLSGGHLIITPRGGTYDVSQANGRKRLRDDANDAAYEVDHNRERVIEKKAEARANGEWPGTPRPFGYAADPGAPGGLALHPAEAPLLAAAYGDLLAGTTLTAIARRWNDAGITGTRGAAWDATAVRRVLRRATNAGLVAHDGQVEGPAQWAAVTDEATWRAACAILASPWRRASRGGAPAWLLSGIALCGACGAGCNVGYGGAGKSARYRCSLANRHMPRAAGRHPSRDAVQLDAFARALVIGRLNREDAALLLRPDHAADRKALLAAEAAQQALWDEQWALYQAKVISARELAGGRATIGGELERIRGQLAALDQADVLAPFIADPEAAWEREGLEQRRAVVAGLLYLTILPAPAGRPPGWRMGQGWFDPAGIDVQWVTRLPSDG